MIINFTVSTHHLPGGRRRASWPRLTPATAPGVSVLGTGTPGVSVLGTGTPGVSVLGAGVRAALCRFHFDEFSFNLVALPRSREHRFLGLQHSHHSPPHHDSIVTVALSRLHSLILSLFLFPSHLFFEGDKSEPSRTPRGLVKHHHRRYDFAKLGEISP